MDSINISKAEDLEINPNITEVRLSYIILLKSDLEKISNIRKLIIDNSHIHFAIRDLTVLGNLKSLVLENNIFSDYINLNELNLLNLEYFKFTGIPKNHFVTIDHLKLDRIISLSFRDIGSHDNLLNRITAKSLRSLNLHSCGITNFKGIEHFPDLAILKITTTDFLRLNNNLNTLKNLIRFEVGGNSISPNDLKGLDTNILNAIIAPVFIMREIDSVLQDRRFLIKSAQSRK